MRCHKPRRVERSCRRQTSAKRRFTPCISFSNKGMQTKISELNRESLLLFDQVWIRRDASVAFPISEDDKDPCEHPSGHSRN